MSESGIIRVRKDRNYISMHRGVFNDARLTWAARGLMGYLLSKGDNWELRVYDLTRQSPAGRDAVYSILKNLHQCGYVRQERQRDRNGRFTWITEIYEVAQEFDTGEELSPPDAGGQETEGSPLPENPEVEKQEEVKPEEVKPDIYMNNKLLNTRITNNTNNTQSRGDSDPVASKERVCVSGSKFSTEEIARYVEDCSRNGQEIKGGLVVWLEQTGRGDHLVAAFLEREGSRQGNSCSSSKTRHSPECPKCFGSGMEVVAGKGARRCTWSGTLPQGAGSTKGRASKRAEESVDKRSSGPAARGVYDQK
jgi:hypothetical protein